MKLHEIFDTRAHYDLEQTADRHARANDEKLAPSKGLWLIDRQSGKKLAGPFASMEKALSFKENRKDKIPADARVVAV